MSASIDYQIDLSSYPENLLYDMLTSGIISASEFVKEMRRRDALLDQVKTEREGAN